VHKLPKWRDDIPLWHYFPMPRYPSVPASLGHGVWPEAPSHFGIFLELHDEMRPMPADLAHPPLK